ncbi:glutaminyl-peptide cyclotransferase [Solwaraspora sp. WMMB335]|uniref:glutaminyl-peptide cyclotransferase n=1 Tax=Solwaraspora sp. WMMB335 TaxID=3404118 RepID=UPI003B94A7A3
MRWRWAVVFALTFAVVAVGLVVLAQPWAPDPASRSASDSSDPAGVSDKLRIDVLARYRHDTGAFTQGLELHGTDLYEGTGQYGESELRVVDLDTGQVRQRVRLSDEVFGEGITIAGPRIWQLTWRAGVAYERDPDTLAEVRQVRYDGEGWGICHDAAAGRLVMSDGSDQLTFRDPQTFTATGSVAVTLDGEPLPRLNELECVGDEVWANVWQTDRIVRIDPASGRVVAEVDAAGLLTGDERAGADVLNGIAAVPGTDEFLITGKYWPALFRVRFVPAV